ncbi:MAG: protein kinase [Polyangiaceae bacterium]|nr:protein kinase [Polyangiaceae bacterium]
MPWPPHRTLYELGHGGMGVVELAEIEGERGPRLVAIKRILPYRGDDARMRRAFLREARLLARIDHPNVVRALGIDEGEGGQPPSLMMQYVAGVSLKELLASTPGGLPVAVAARLGLDVARGLHAAHELCDEAGHHLDIVHRDVSPHNVLVTFDGSAVLLDFGVAKINDATRTLTGEVKGKLAYMAPEQAMADPVDRRSDIYALGALLYEMLSGRRMHGEGTDLEILKRMVSERPVPLASLRPDLPASFAALVARMTEESPDRRPANADEVATALAPHAAVAPAPALAAYLQGRMPAARREHDQRIAIARAGGKVPGPSRTEPSSPTLAAGRTSEIPPAATRPSQVPPAATRPSQVPPAATRPSQVPPAPATGRSSETPPPPATGRSSQVPPSAASRYGEGLLAYATNRQSQPSNAPAAPRGRLSPLRRWAIALGAGGLGLGVLGVVGALSEQVWPPLAEPRPLSNVAPTSTPALDAAKTTPAPSPLSPSSPSPASPSSPSPLSPSSPSPASARPPLPEVRVGVAPPALSDAEPASPAAPVAAAAAAAPSSRRARPPRRAPAASASPSAPARPPPRPLPVDVGAIGDDDR